jgi:hypothetical protein
MVLPDGSATFSVIPIMSVTTAPVAPFPGLSCTTQNIALPAACKIKNGCMQVNAIAVDPTTQKIVSPLQTASTSREMT